MVARRGRGAKAQVAKAKVEEAPEAQVQDTEMAEPVEVEEGNNGDAAAGSHDEVEGEAGGENIAEGGEESATQEGTDADAKTEEEKKEEEKKEEEKVETGKLLVENLPSSYLFDYQEKLKELFSKYGEVNNIKRGPIIVTELTTTPTLSAIVEFKNKESLEKALVEDGTVLDGSPISVVAESRPETAVLVGVPYEASSDYVRILFSHCGDVAHIHEFSKTKYKILRVTFVDKESVEKALKLDRELRINGFLVTVSKYRDEDEQKAHSAVNKNKRQHPQQNQQQNRNNQNNAVGNNSNANNRGGGSFRARGNSFNARGGGNFRGRGGRGAFASGWFPRGGFPAPALPPQGYMGRPGGFMNDGQRPNKRQRQ